MPQSKENLFDIFIVGGGINGCGIARDATGRGLKVGLAEMGDLASATSSASTKLFHGGLRYLEYFEFRLVREALKEREILLQNMPHISWPMRFVIPYHDDMRFDNSTPASRLLSTIFPWMRGRRPAWMIRLGLFIYDYMGGRKILPPTSSINLEHSPTGQPLYARFKKAYEYSDCWVEDSRLVSLNAQDAAQRGATIMTRTKVVNANRLNDHWEITIQDVNTHETRMVTAKVLINAAGPWVEDVVKSKLRINAREGVRLVRGSHIVTKRLFNHDKCYFFQGRDGRIIFAIPYENDFTLIGTTDSDHENLEVAPYCTKEEQNYLLEFANTYFSKTITADDVVWTFSGTRPLLDDGADSASAATRDYKLLLNTDQGAPLLNIFGGKITTYRRLAESAMDKIGQFFPQMTPPWTAITPLPGGNFSLNEIDEQIENLMNIYPFLDQSWATRMIKTYGTQAQTMLGGAKTISDLGHHFGASLYENEVQWLITHEFAQTAQDIIWRRTKLGLRLEQKNIASLDQWMLKKVPYTI